MEECYEINKTIIIIERTFADDSSELIEALFSLYSYEKHECTNCNLL